VNEFFVALMREKRQSVNYLNLEEFSGISMKGQMNLDFGVER